MSYKILIHFLKSIISPGCSTSKQIISFTTKSPNLLNSKSTCMSETSICFFFFVTYFALLYIVSFTTPDVFQIETFRFPELLLQSHTFL